MTKLHELHEAGQSVWLDFIKRDMLAGGELASLVADGIRGLTSNPTIFQKAIGGSDLYDAQILEVVTQTEVREPSAAATVGGITSTERPEWLAQLLSAAVVVAVAAMVAVFGRSMRDQPSFDPYENTMLPPENSVSFSSGNFPAAPGEFNIGHPESVDVPPFTMGSGSDIQTFW